MQYLLKAASLLTMLPRACHCKCARRLQPHLSRLIRLLLRAGRRRSPRSHATGGVPIGGLRSTIDSPAAAARRIPRPTPAPLNHRDRRRRRPLHERRERRILVLRRRVAAACLIRPRRASNRVSRGVRRAPGRAASWRSVPSGRGARACRLAKPRWCSGNASGAACWGCGAACSAGAAGRAASGSTWAADLGRRPRRLVPPASSPAALGMRTWRLAHNARASRGTDACRVCVGTPSLLRLNQSNTWQGEPHWGMCSPVHSPSSKSCMSRKGHC